MSSPEPLVSIIIPCFNAAPWLQAAVDSCLRQTWTKREIIIINDGSTDNSLAVAQSVAGPGVEVIDQPNRGAAAARNRGLGTAKGQLIQYLDADDLLAPDKIEQQVVLFRSRPDARLSAGQWARFSGNPADAVFGREPNARDLSGVEYLQLFFEHGAMMHPAAWLCTRSLLNEAGPWNESLSLNDDGEYFARVALAAGKIHFCAGAKSYYRSNIQASLSGRKDGRALESLFRSFELELEYLGARDASPRTQAALAHGWKWLAYELYPGRPDLARRAEERSRALGWSTRPFPGSGRFQLAARFLGWRLAKRLCG